MNGGDETAIPVFVDQATDPVLRIPPRAPGERAISSPPLYSCCAGCHLEECLVHRLPDLVILAGQEAGCFPSDSGRRSWATSVATLADVRVDPLRFGTNPKPHPGHRLIFDGKYPELMHLHHEGRSAVLLLPRVSEPSEALAGELLSWIEAIHWGWLD